jgi:hypothetical protein
MSRHFEGFELVKSKRGGTESKFEQIVIGPKYVSLNAVLRKKLQGKHIGFYVNYKEKQMLLHISPVKQIGYYSAKPYQLTSKDLLKSFHDIGIGKDTILIIDRLTYLDQDTIVIRK